MSEFIENLATSSQGVPCAAFRYNYLEIWKTDALPQKIKTDELVGLEERS